MFESEQNRAKENPLSKFQVIHSDYEYFNLSLDRIMGVFILWSVGNILYCLLYFIEGSAFLLYFLKIFINEFII